MRSLTRRLLGGAAVIVLAAGCSQKPEMAQVSGTVTFQGKPVPAGWISFTPEPGKGSVAYADGHLYVRSERGKVTLVEANPARFVEKGRFEQPDRSTEPAWPHPVIAGGKLYLRDQDVLLCYDVKAKQ